MNVPSDEQESLNVLHFQGECLVVAKPGGILTQAPPGIESMESLVRRFFRKQDQVPISENVYVGMPHRLDRPASGVMLFGKSRKTTRKLAQQFEKRTVRKTYWALVEGCPNSSDTWEDSMRKVPGHASSEIVSPEHPDAQVARLNCQILTRNDMFALLEIQLETGRTHQIRLQTSHRGCPIVGDAQYGSQFDFGPATLDQRKRWIALHARSIDFWHPQLHRPVCVTADLPAPWLELDSGLDLKSWDQQQRSPGTDESGE